MQRIMEWLAPMALVAMPWVAQAQVSPTTPTGGAATFTSTAPSTTNTVMLPAIDTTPLSRDEPDFDVFESSLGLGVGTDFNSFAARLGVGPAAATLPALTSLQTTATATDSGATSSTTAGTTTSLTSSTTVSAVGTSTGLSTSAPSSIPAIGTSMRPTVAAVPIGTQATRTTGSALGSLGRTSMRSLIPNSARAVPTVGPSGGPGPGAAGSARSGTVFDEPCEPEEVLCIDIR